MSDAKSVLEFWFGAKPASAEEMEARGKFWFGGGEAVDREIKERFAGLVEEARAGKLDDWANEDRTLLALVIVLDQFTRNVYRGSGESFAADARALELAELALGRGAPSSFDALERLFLILPFSHSEALEHQKRAVALMQKAALDARPEWQKFYVGGVDFARKHLDVIARFGRFPHRNALLGRENTAEESEYLAYLKAAGQWL